MSTCHYNPMTYSCLTSLSSYVSLYIFKSCIYIYIYIYIYVSYIYKSYIYIFTYLIYFRYKSYIYIYIYLRILYILYIKVVYIYIYIYIFSKTNLDVWVVILIVKMGIICQKVSGIIYMCMCVPSSSRSVCMYSLHILSPSIPIVYRSEQVLLSASCACTEMMNISFCWSVSLWM